MIEEWRDIPGWEGFYRVSSLGRVMALDRVVGWRGGKARRKQQPRKLIKNRKGYTWVKLRDGKRVKNALVHHLVLDAFVGPRPAGTEACHNNGVRDDNRPDNLRWDTRKANHGDKVAHGTQQSGERCWKHKLTEAEVSRILDDTRPHVEIARDYGVSDSTINRIKSRQTWRCVRP